MTNYEFLQTIVNRFPTLMGLDCQVFPNKVKVIITDAKGETVLYKEMTIEGTFDNDEQIEHIKNESAFDLICHLCLVSHGNIRNEILRTKDKIKSQLN